MYSILYNAEWFSKDLYQFTLLPTVYKCTGLSHILTNLDNVRSDIFATLMGMK